jgi:hypothetical protein
MKLTPVFPASILPVRSGVYATQQIDEDGNLGPFGCSYFDATDRIWGCTHRTVDEAAANPEFEFAVQTKMWQGLAEEPKP